MAALAPAPTLGRSVLDAQEVADMTDLGTDTIEIRAAQSRDERALTRLAQLDSARVPRGPLLLAFEGGELRAAISLATGGVIADPFAPTARLVGLLRFRAAPPRRPRRARLRLMPAAGTAGSGP
jgi:hypothetical protein